MFISWAGPVCSYFPGYMTTIENRGEIPAEQASRLGNRLYGCDTCQEVARALITNPKLVLADEPTGALDSKATEELLRLFGKINMLGQTIIMVTHSVKAASSANRVLFIRDGEVFHQIFRGKDTNEQLYQKISDTLTLLATGGERQ